MTKITFLKRLLPFTFIMLLLSISPTSFAQKKSKVWNSISSATPASSEIKLISSDINSSTIEINTSGYWKESIRQSEENTEYKVYAENSTPLLIQGAPDLEKLTASLIIPDKARMQINIIEEKYVDYQDINIIPSKGNLTRDINPATVPYEYGREYLSDAFFPGVVAELRTPHIIRDIRGQVLVIYPFRYNPVQKTLRVYTRLVIEVKSVGEDGENVLGGRGEKEMGRRGEDFKTVRSFNGIYERNFINYEEYRGSLRYTPLEEDGNMLIISYGTFMSSMQDFVNWKNMSGIPTEMVNVSSIGTTAAQIKAYVANYYNTNGLTYLLIVGDHAQVPASSTTAGYSDNDYGYIVGSDHYPDIFVGRFSAENTSHVQTQVQRTLNYEKFPNLSPAYYERSMCIASAEGPGDDSEYDWQHQRNLRNDYMAFTYSYGAELYDGSQGGQDATGNPTTTMVATEINTGTGIISYTGHGSNTSWGTTGYSNTNIATLTNTNKLPFILSVACVNGNFPGYTCFAEAWLRATYNGQPSGAVATFMSTINQSWNPPMQGQDEMVDILVETYPNNIKRTFGGICMNGCMNMNDVYGSGGADMTDTWTIFGDPSLMVRTDAPVTMTVSYEDNIPVGCSQLTVFCSEEGARVAVSSNYSLLGSAFVSGGSANVAFGQINIEDTLTVTVTAFNCIPSVDSVIVSDLEMSYGSCTAFHSNLSEVGPGQEHAEVLGVRVVMAGSQNPFNLVSLSFNMNGTSNLADAEGLSVYYTGNSSTYSPVNLFGTASVSSGTITITGEQTLGGGYNHFWLAYDLAETATTGNYIDAECTGLIIDDNISLTRIPTVTDPSGQRQINVMQLVSVTATQANTSAVAPGAANTDIIRVEVVTNGLPQPLQVNSINISTQGTTMLSDISLISIYYTTAPVFSSSQLFGTATPAGTVTITGNQVLTDGTNYFWVTYNVSASAGAGHQLDAECPLVTFSGITGTQVPTITDPAGYRLIQFNYCIPAYTSGTGYGDYITLVSLGTLYKATGASPAPYYNYYQDVTTHLVPGNTYTLTLSPGTYGSGNYLAAWIDFNRNGTFDTSEKLGEILVGATPATGTINFLVPTSASLGETRLRVREVWNITSLSACTSYTYGETEDYDVNILPAGCWLGYSNVWNSASNWSDGLVPGANTQVIIPEILMGSYYPEVFPLNISIDELETEDGSSMEIPVGVTITIGAARQGTPVNK